MIDWWLIKREDVCVIIVRPMYWMGGSYDWKQSGSNLALEHLVKIITFPQVSWNLEVPPLGVE